MNNKEPLQQSQVSEMLLSMNINEEDCEGLSDSLINALINFPFWPYKNEYFMKVIGKLGTNSTIEKLAEITKAQSSNNSFMVRSCASYAIGKIARGKWDAHFDSIYRNAGATYASSEIVNSEIVFTLLNCFLENQNDDDGKFFNYFAWQALNEINSFEVLQPLLLAFKENRVVNSVKMVDASGYQFLRPKKRLAFEFLGHCGDTNAIPFLVASLNDENDENGYASIGALANINTPEALAEIEKYRNKLELINNGAKTALKDFDEKDTVFSMTYTKKWQLP